MPWDSVDSGVLSAVMGCVSVLLRAVLGWVPMGLSTPPNMGTASSDSTEFSDACSGD